MLVTWVKTLSKSKWKPSQFWWMVIHCEIYMNPIPWRLVYHHKLNNTWVKVIILLGPYLVFCALGWPWLWQKEDEVPLQSFNSVWRKLYTGSKSHRFRQSVRWIYKTRRNWKRSRVDNDMCRVPPLFCGNCLCKTSGQTWRKEGMKIAPINKK